MPHLCQFEGHGLLLTCIGKMSESSFEERLQQALERHEGKGSHVDRSLRLVFFTGLIVGIACSMLIASVPTPANKIVSQNKNRWRTK